MSEPINWRQLCEKLARPWWGPHAPDDYTIMYRGQKAGVGLIHNFDYGAWNLMLAHRGSYDLPTTREEHAELVPKLIAAKNLGLAQILGQPLGSYTMLMTPNQFYQWVTDPQKPIEQHLRTLLKARIGSLIKLKSSPP